MYPFKERPAGYHNPSEIIIAPPTFDISAAAQAYSDAKAIMYEPRIEGILEEDTDAVLSPNVSPMNHMLAVNSAVAIMLYNKGVNLETIRHYPQLKRRIQRLVADEAVAQRPNNPLPTIGFEIEIPTIHAKKQMNEAALLYENLSHAFGFPPNNNNDLESQENRDIGSYEAFVSGYIPSYWEIASNFSYHSGTQKEILLQLFRSRLIPRFRPEFIAAVENPDEKSKKIPKNLTEAVYQELSHQGLALHVNIGIPIGINENTHEYVAEYRIAGAVCAIALSSQERLNVTDIGDSLIKHNVAEPSLKNEDENGRRLEFRGLEIITRNNAHTLDTIQLISTALFEKHKINNRDETLSKIWEGFIDQVLDIMPVDLHEMDFRILGNVLEKRINVAEIALQNPYLKRDLSTIVLATASQVRNHLVEKGWLPPSA